MQRRWTRIGMLFRDQEAVQQSWVARGRLGIGECLYALLLPNGFDSASGVPK